ncbi:hypothetical protein TWF694_007990 [Orbilia ellipsospora]|uniref:Uncharacterized protein n=1 Tax=Orbilia ellipsospora TaxID=2528407 RepID=A0AAV9XER1_9PEZI
MTYQIQLSKVLLVPLLAAASAAAFTTGDSGASGFERRQARPPVSADKKGTGATTPPSGEAIKNAILSSPMTKGLKPDQLQVLKNMDPKIYAKIPTLPEDAFNQAMNDIGAGKAPKIPDTPSGTDGAKQQKPKPQGPQTNPAGRPRLRARANESEGQSLKTMVLEQAKSKKLPPKIINFINGLQPQVFDKIIAGPPQDFGKSMSTILSGKLPQGIAPK